MTDSDCDLLMFTIIAQFDATSSEEMAFISKEQRMSTDSVTDDSASHSVLPQFESKQPFPPLLADDLAIPSQDAPDTSFTEDDPDIAEEEDYDANFQSQYSLDDQLFSDASTDESDGQSPEDDGIEIHPFRHSTSSLHGPNAFAPPFYNRPPTPLPPSPSLTSLLRPPFSTTTSRPTTPDSSDVETPNDTEAAVAKSARRATTVPRASPKVPTYEYYGFVLYLASSLAFCKCRRWLLYPGFM